MKVAPKAEKEVIIGAVAEKTYHEKGESLCRVQQNVFSLNNTMNTPVREGETIEGSRTMRNRPYPVLKCGLETTQDSLESSR